MPFKHALERGRGNSVFVPESSRCDLPVPFVGLNKVAFTGKAQYGTDFSKCIFCINEHSLGGFQAFQHKIIHRTEAGFVFKQM